MSLVPDSEVREVPDINASDLGRIRDFLQGAVYCWCKNRKDEWFSLQKLMGGENFDWQGTPLYRLYEEQINSGLTNEAAIERAGQQGGWILKALLRDDRRAFETAEGTRSREYRWLATDQDR